MEDQFAPVLNAFEDLQRSLNLFCELLIEQKPKHWLYNSANSTKSLAEIYQDIWYFEGKDGRETNSYYGLVAASTELLALAEKLNQSKTEFQSRVKLFKQQNASALPELKAYIGYRNKPLNSQLQGSGLARLHLKQAHRLVPILDETPTKVGFNWYSSGRSIKKISKQDALKKLENLGPDKPHIQPQWLNLSSINDKEPLALVQDLAPIIRANIQFENGQRKASNVALPILFPEHSFFPEYSEPPKEAPTERTRSRRSDNKLEDHPFLPSIRVYKYRVK